VPVNLPAHQSMPTNEMKIMPDGNAIAASWENPLFRFFGN
jgi:hypothetical protein